MYVLYLDESGNENSPSDKHFVLGGAAVFERQTYYLSRALDELQARHFPGVQPIEFHASHIRSGKEFWRRVDSTVRNQILQGIANGIAGIPESGIVLFAAVIVKSERLYGEDAVVRAAEEVCKRFDTFLMRRYHEHEDPQRGLLVFAEGRFHEKTRGWLRRFRELGTKWGALRNLSDIPYYASTSETRLLQVADFVAHAIFRLYEENDATLILPVLPRFDQKGGVLHGLVHVKSGQAQCECPACRSRISPGDFGPWVR